MSKSPSFTQGMAIVQLNGKVLHKDPKSLIAPSNSIVQELASTMPCDVLTWALFGQSGPGG